MLKKILFLFVVISAIVSNVFALDIYDTYIVGSNITIDDDVHVHPGGVIINNDNSWWSLTITGNLINEGSIQDNSGGYGLELYPKGSITNTGTISCYRVRVQGTAQQSISSNSAITATYFNVDNSFGMIATGDISFSNCAVDFNSYILDLTAGYDLIMDDGYLYEADVKGIESSEINLSNTAYLIYTDITDCSLNGTVEIASDVELFGNVSNNGILQNYSNSPYSLIINGNFTNHGTIQDNVYSFTVDAYGDIENYATWNNYRLDLKGTVPQTLSLFDSAVFNTTYLSNFNSTSIIPGTDLSFSNTNIDFKDNTLDLTSGYDLILDGGYIYMVDIVGSATSNLNMTNLAFLQDVDITDITLKGTIEIASDQIWMYGDIVNDGIIQNRSNGSWKLNLDGNLTNNGTIRNNGGYFLEIDSYGNITNDGIWTFDDLNLKGTSPQTILSTNGSTFSNYLIESFNSTGVIAGSDLNFSNCRIDFNDHDLDLSIGYNVFIDSEFIYMTNIIGSPTSFLDMSNSAYLQDVDITDIILNGTTEIASDLVWFYGNIVNDGIIQNRSNGSWKLNLDGNLTNNGTIRNNGGYFLDIDSYGNITNDGIWTFDDLNLKGTSPQTILSSNESVFSNYAIENLNSTGVIAGSDLSFSNCIIDFNDYDLDLSAGYDMIVDGAYIYMANIIGSATSVLEMSNYAQLRDIDITDITLKGTIEIASDLVWFYGDIVNDGIIQNFSNSSWKLNVDGNITNNGAVRNNPAGYNLTIDAYGDITNGGVWSNYYTKLVGSSDQNVLLMNNSSIYSYWFSIFSELTAGSLQWYYQGSVLDDVNWSGETGVELYLTDTSLNNTYNGTYYCETGDGPSRNIIISSMVYESPNITSVVNNGTNIIIDWNDIASAVSYKVYSSEDPYALSHTWEYEAEVFTNSASLTAPIEDKKFYFVKAIY